MYVSRRKFLQASAFGGVFTGFGMTLYTWAFCACRITSRVGSAVTSRAGNCSLNSRTCSSASNPVIRGMCMSNSTR